MLSLGVMEESNSAWSSPVVLHRKPGKNRLCLDSRKLNAVTVDAFWQIPLERGSREKTAFTVPGRPLYHYTVMPFGLCNAPQTMSRLMDKVIPPSLRTEVFVYLDDLLIISDTF